MSATARNALRPAGDAPELAEARFRSLVEHLPALTFTATLDHRLTYVGPQVERLLGTPVATWLGEPTAWLSHVHAEDRDRLIGAMRDAVRRNAPTRCEARLLRPRVVWVLAEMAAVPDASGHPAAIQVLALDITDRKRAEDGLRRSEIYHRSRVEHAHDLTLVLTAQGLVRYASAHPGRESRRPARREPARARRRRRPRAHRATVARRGGDRGIHRRDGAARPPRRRVVAHPGRGCPQRGRASRRRRRHRERAGRHRAAGGRVDPRAAAPPDPAVGEAGGDERDAGRHLPRAQQPAGRRHRPHRLAGAHRRRGGGGPGPQDRRGRRALQLDHSHLPGGGPAVSARAHDGLPQPDRRGGARHAGLSAARGCHRRRRGARLLAARPRVDPGPGRGATFRIDLPVGAAVATPEPPEIEPLATTLRVLIVDDEAEVGEVMGELLRGDGHEVDAATDGVEALTRLQSREYDVVLSDIRMPGLDGLELWNTVKQCDPAMAERFVFFTGDTLSAATAEVLERSGVPSIKKPFGLDDVRAALARVGGSRSAHTR